MSAEEIVRELGIDVDQDTLAELQEHVEACGEIQALEAGAANASAKLFLVGTGSTIYAKFQPGPHGKGPCHKKGTGGFHGPGVPSGISGQHKLEVGRVTVKLYRGSSVIWKGHGLQKGLSGTWEVTF